MVEQMRLSFNDIISNNKIVIPIIQRDYAQGREDVKTTRVRELFLKAIFSVLSEAIKGGNQAVLELDFIYGQTATGSVNRFYPLDGQQRLTTLWLLYWYVASRENISEEEKDVLRNFTYETRHSTTLFCEKLTNFFPKLGYGSISQEIKDQSWYFEYWNFDPSVRAMLVMLDSIESEYNDLPTRELWPVLTQVENPLMLYMLDMDKIGLADDLYIKMNSRGKSLTEFEYFKVGFLELIEDDKLKKRFEESIDGEWSDFVWSLVKTSSLKPKRHDLAELVDECFLRLINYISIVLARQYEIDFTDVDSVEKTKLVYSSTERLEFLFDTLDLLSAQQNRDPQYWDQLFYYSKSDFNPDKVRLYFAHKKTNLLEVCLFNYDSKGRGFTLQEQLLFYACIVDLKHNFQDFNRKLRVVRNLVVNSDNELRADTIRNAFSEITSYLVNNKLDVFKYFKTLQIDEESEKLDFISNDITAVETLFKLEDSDILRGSISIFDFDSKFVSRANRFLTLFDENLGWHERNTRADLLFCFGDYTQDDGDLTNVLSGNPTTWRRFFTAPGYNKTQLVTKTKIVLMACLDWFNSNSNTTVDQKITDVLTDYENKAKDWMYYFLNYSQFRHQCNKGYYFWRGDDVPYCCFKMKERQFNGYHWDPYLKEIKNQVKSHRVDLSNYQGKLEISVGETLLEISVVNSGYKVSSNDQDSASTNKIFDELVKEGIVDSEGLHKVTQTSNFEDLEDRVDVGVNLVNTVLSKG